MALRFYNTLTQQVEPFAPLDDNTVRMYTCGPTVYNLRAYRQLADLHFRGHPAPLAAALAAISSTT